MFVFGFEGEVLEFVACCEEEGADEGGGKEDNGKVGEGGEGGEEGQVGDGDCGEEGLEEVGHGGGGGSK